MAYSKVESKKRFIGVLLNSDEAKIPLLIDDSDCDLILFDRETEEYYKVLQIAATLPIGGPEEVLFTLEIDLNDPNQVEFKGK